MRRIIWLAPLLIAPAVWAAWDYWNEDDRERPSEWNLRPPDPDAEPFHTEEQLFGIYPVGSRVTVRSDLGGFGPCTNFPIDLGNRGWGRPGELSLIAFSDEPCAYFKSKGIALRVVNRSGSRQKLSAVDSKLLLVAQAIDPDGAWRDIERLSSILAFCGNSIHHVVLKDQQYWEFPARQYDGPFKTKIRYRLEVDQQTFVFSNEIDGEIELGQFVEPAQVKFP